MGLQIFKIFENDFADELEEFLENKNRKLQLVFKTKRSKEKKSEEIVNINMFANQYAKYTITSKVVASIGAASLKSFPLSQVEVKVEQELDMEMKKQDLMHTYAKKSWPLKKMINETIIDEIVQAGKKDQLRMIDYFNVIYDLLCQSYFTDQSDLSNDHWINLKGLFWKKLVDFDHQNLSKLSITLPGYLESQAEKKVLYIEAEI